LPPAAAALEAGAAAEADAAGADEAAAAAEVATAAGDEVAVSALFVLQPEASSANAATPATAATVRAPVVFVRTIVASKYPIGSFPLRIVDRVASIVNTRTPFRYHFVSKRRRESAVNASQGVLPAEPELGQVERLPQRQALADDVYEAINALLMDSVIAPDARITIDTLARQLGVSPTPVREALARLESDGLVVKQGLRGYFATPRLSLDEMKDMYQLRLLIEPWAAGRAAERADAKSKQRLSEELRTLPTAPRQPDYAHLKAMSNHDSRFHDLILELAGNEFVRQSFIRSHCHLHLFRLQYGKSATTMAASAAVQEHKAITAAIRRQDAVAATEAMRQHLSLSRDRIVVIFG
jgi:DNA-binding GntR family transcriptional regulator